MRGEHLGQPWDTYEIAKFFNMAEHETYNILARMRRQTYDTADSDTVRLLYQVRQGGEDHQQTAVGQ